MDFKSLLVLVLSWASARPSVDRYITELPSNSHWEYDGMVADQPYAPVRPSASSYIYQIDDPTANYIYTTNYWSKKDHTVYKKRSTSSNTVTWTPTRRPNSISRSISISEAIPAAPVTLPVTYTTSEAEPATYYGASTTYYPINHAYASNVYTTPYGFSGPTNAFVQPNVLYSDYSTYLKPVYVVNNALDRFVPPLHSILYIFENPKQYVVNYVPQQQQPVASGEGDDHDATKNLNNSSTNTEVNMPIKVQNNSSTVAGANKPILAEIHKKPIETNLTKINIDPITEAKAKYIDGRWVRAALTTSSSNIIHKQRPIYYNTFGIMYHKLPHE